tara:strand:+ start:10249 stop:11808 length:1560 start_codon:yes stop_codon:yes gene_type:complete
MKFNVCILAAGIGSRMGILGKTLNKAIFPYKGKGLISHIIDKFPKNSNFIIAVGYKDKQLIDYLKIAHKEQFHNIRIVKINNFNGSGSGPGLSLYKCRKYLVKPFYFVSCDTIIDQALPIDIKNNWVGTNRVLTSISSDYCNFFVLKSEVKKIFDKKKYENKKMTSFIGLMFIKDINIFWEGLKNSTKSKTSPQISMGLQNIIDKKFLHEKKTKWLDLGTEDKYKEAILKNNPYDFTKKDETIFFYKNKVIKYFSEKNISKERFLKSKINHNVFPTCKIINNFYYYNFIDGKTVYQEINNKVLTNLLLWLEKKLWIKKKIDKVDFKNLCHNFYKIKTQERIKLYKKKYPNYNFKSINGEKINSVDFILNKINWKYLIDGIPTFIHGDLQFDNIIYNNKTNKFKLIDWRHNFDKSIKVGDIYYDLSKLYGGFLIDYSSIKDNKFQYSEKKMNISFRLLYKNKLDSEFLVYKKYLKDNHYDLNKIKILTAIIFLNMSPLHEYPFDKFLFAYGIKLLDKHTK